MSESRQRVLAYRNEGALPNTKAIDTPLGKILAATIFAVCVFLMFHVNFRAEKDVDYIFGVLMSLSLAYFLLKMLISFFYTPAKGEPGEHKVSVVVPCYNESTYSVQVMIESLLKQSYPVHEIIFVDDGSADITTYQAVKKLAEENPKIRCHRFEKNKGKKEGQKWAFERATGDIIMLTDSDSYISRHAVKEMLRQFRDEKVSSVVGHINARNENDSFITRLQDILYQGAFRVGRGAQSVTGTVLVCSGALSMHRREVVMDNLDFFMKEKRLGIAIKNGDDRCLTIAALKSGGKTKYQSTATAVTDVPEDLTKFFKQQTRWARSFFLYSMVSLKYAWKRPSFLFWLIGEGAMWALFTTSVIQSLTKVTNLTATNWQMYAYYTICYLILASLNHGLYYIFRNPFRYFLAPLFALAHMAIIFPVRLYALLTIWKDNWGTR